MTVVPARVAGRRSASSSPRPADRDGTVAPGPARRRRPAGGRRVRRRRRRPGHRGARLRPARAASQPVDRIVGPGQRLGHRGQARGLRRGRRSTCPPARPRAWSSPTPPADPRLVAADLITQAEHGPDSPAILVTTDAAFADAVEAEVADQLADAPRGAPSSSASLGEHGRIVLAPDLDAAIAFANAYAPEHLSVDVEPLEPTVARLRNAGSLFVGPWAPESAGDYATGANHVLPTGGLARASGGLAVEAFGKFIQVQRLDARRPRGASATTIATLAEAEGLIAHRDAVEIRFEDRDRPMSPTPVTFTLPDRRRPRYSLGGDRRGGRGALRRPDRATIVRFDLNTSPAPPALVARLLAAGRFETAAVRVPAGRLPTARRGGRRALRRRRRRDPRRGRRRRDPRPHRQGVPAGRSARRRPDRRPTRCTASYTEQRGAHGRRRPAPRRGGRLRARPDRRSGRGRADDGRRRLAVQPEQPHRRCRSRRRDRGAPRGLAADAAAAALEPPIVVLDEAYAEFVGPLARRPARRYPNLIVVRTASKAYALAGLRVGFAIARPELIARARTRTARRAPSRRSRPRS